MCDSTGSWSQKQLEGAVENHQNWDGSKKHKEPVLVGNGKQLAMNLGMEGILKRPYSAYSQSSNFSLWYRSSSAPSMSSKVCHYLQITKAKNDKKSFAETSRFCSSAFLLVEFPDASQRIGLMTQTHTQIRHVFDMSACPAHTEVRLRFRI